jgi:hypothetical protein
MSDTEDYPGPSRNLPEKEGKDSVAQADEEMVKPPARPKVDSKKAKKIRPISRKKLVDKK